MRVREILMATCLTALGAPSPAIAGPNLVTNGDFESGLDGWSAHGWGAHSNEFGDTTGTASANCVGADCIRDGNGDFAINGYSVLWQDIATVAGHNYALNFDFVSAGDPMELAVLFGSDAVFDETGMATIYTNYSLTGLVATSATTRLYFLGRQDPSHDGLDNVVLTDTSASTPSVPEPRMWTLMLLGFGAVGSSVRRARRTLALA
jgi:hypothetical protein